MFLKLVKNVPFKEQDTHLIEGDHFHWGWRKELPEEYWSPFANREGFKFAIKENPDGNQVMVVEVYRNGLTVKTIVVMGASCYVMSDDGKTIDKFAA